MLLMEKNFDCGHLIERPRAVSGVQGACRGQGSKSAYISFALGTFVLVPKVGSKWHNFRYLPTWVLHYIHIWFHLKNYLYTIIIR